MRASEGGPRRRCCAVVPLGVYLERGAGAEFMLACGLTMAGFLPGMVFALTQVMVRER